MNFIKTGSLKLSCDVVQDKTKILLGAGVANIVLLGCLDNECNEKIEDNFTFIIACNSIHVGRGMKMAPKAKLDDGLIDLIVVRANITRARLLKTLPKLFDGTHIEEPEVS